MGRLSDAEMNSVSKKDSRELAREARQVNAVTAGKKYSPARLRLLLNQVEKMPVIASACRLANCSYSGVKYWLKKSAEGVPGDGFDLEWNGEVKRFHEHWADAFQVGVDRVEEAMFNRAIGYKEVGVHQGRVQYKYDPDLIALGFEGPSAYLLDELGQPIPETITKQDPDLQMFILKSHRPEVYGNKSNVDVNVRGGVLVVGAVAKDAAEFDKRYLNKKVQDVAIDVEFEEVPAEGAQ